MVIYISVQSTSSIKLGLPRSDQGVGRNPPLIVKGFFILVGGGNENA